MLKTIFKMKNLSDFSYFLLNIRKVFSQLKIFWRIFMRQISLTDYFCKGFNLFKRSSETTPKSGFQTTFSHKVK